MLTGLSTMQLRTRRKDYNKPNPVGSQFNVNICSDITKDMAFHDTHPERTKISINDAPVEQVLDFNYLGCDVNYDFDRPQTP